MKMDNNTPETDRFFKKIENMDNKKMLPENQVTKSIHYEIDVIKILPK